MVLHHPQAYPIVLVLLKIARVSAVRSTCDEPQRQRIGPMEVPNMLSGSMERPRWNGFSGAKAGESGSLLVDLAWIGFFFGSQMYDLSADNHPGLIGDGSPGDRHLIEVSMVVSSDHFVREKIFPQNDTRLNGKNVWYALISQARGRGIGGRLSDLALGFNNPQPTQQQWEEDVYWHTYTFYPASRSTSQTRTLADEMWNRVDQFFQRRAERLEAICCERAARDDEYPYHPFDLKQKYFQHVITNFQYWKQKQEHRGLEWKYTVRTLALLVEDYMRSLGLLFVLDPPEDDTSLMRAPSVRFTTKSVSTFTFSQSGTFKEQCVQLQHMVHPERYHELGRLTLNEFPSPESYDAKAWPIGGKDGLYVFLHKLAAQNTRIAPGVVRNTVCHWLSEMSTKLFEFPRYSGHLGSALVPLSRGGFFQNFKEKVGVLKRTMKEKYWNRLAFVPLHAYPFPQIFDVANEDCTDRDLAEMKDILNQAIQEKFYGRIEDPIAQQQVTLVFSKWLSLMASSYPDNPKDVLYSEGLL